MTQQDLADRLRVSNKTVSKWECGDSYPEITLVPVIAEVFDVTSDEILKGERALSKAAPTEKSAAKTELQVKRLLQSSITRYKNINYIAIALFLAGYIMQLALSYALVQPAVGFAVMLIFVIAGVVLAIINVSRTQVILKYEDMTEQDLRLFQYNIEIFLKHALVVFSIGAAVVLISLPVIVAVGVAWPAGVTEMDDFSYYLWKSRHFALGAIVLFWTARLVMHLLLAEKEQYEGISVYSRNARVTRIQAMISVVFALLLV